jgi:predicted RNase H-like HicB family nuclease
MNYTVECVRSGDWWAITVPELRGVFSQARRLDQVEPMAREAIALMLDVDVDSFHVEVKPKVPDEVVRARQARSALREAEQSAEEATRHAATELLRQGYTVRDAGKLLGISPQRVSQITASKPSTREKPRADAKGRRAA